MKSQTLRFILRMGMENVFNAEDDKHGKDDVAEDDQQGVAEILESHGFEHHSGDHVDSGEDKSVEKDPSEVLRSGFWAVNILKFDIVTAIQPMGDVRAYEHHQRAGEGGVAEGVRESIHHES